jgi:hypothetical protein
LTAELEYPDANGERLTATAACRTRRHSRRHPPRRLGRHRGQLAFKIVALDLDGRPLPKQELRVSCTVSDHSYRKRLIGALRLRDHARDREAPRAGV